MKKFTSNLKLFLLLAAMVAGVNSVFAAWTGSGQGTKQNGVWYALYNTGESNFSTISSKEYTLSAPGDKLSFDGKCVAIMGFWGGDLKAAQYVNGSWSSALYQLKCSKKDTYYNSSKIQLDNAATKVKLYTETGATGKKYMKNVFVTMATYFETPSKTALDYDEDKVGADSVQKVTIAWCNTPAMTYSVVNNGGDAAACQDVEVTWDVNSKAGEYNTSTLTIKYNRAHAGTLKANLVITSGSLSQTIALSGVAGREMDEISFETGRSIILLDEEYVADWAVNKSGLPITYTSSDPSILKIEDGKIIGVARGTVTLTASSAGDATYTSASTSIDVKVRDNDDPCETLLLDETKSVRFVNTDDDDTYALQDGPRGTLTYQWKKLTLITIDGTNRLMGYDSSTSSWRELKKLGTPSTSWQWDSYTFTSADQSITKLKWTSSFEEGSKNVQNVALTQLSYLTASTGSLTMPTVAVCEKAYCEFNIDYSDVARLSLTQTNADFEYEVYKNGIKISDFDNDCGDYGTYTVRIVGSPSHVGAYSNTVTIEAAGKSQVITISGTATAPAREIVWEQAAGEILSDQTVTLNAYAKTECENPAGTVQYTITAGGDIASISAGVLSFTGAGTVTVEASTIADANYQDATPVSKTWTVSAPAPEVYVFTTDGEWGTDANWENGNKPVSTDADVVIAADVVINGEVEVNSLTINEGASVMVEVSGKLTVGDGDSEDQAAYGDLYVHNNGEVVLNNGKVNVNNFYIESAPTAKNQTAASGQLENAGKLQYANAYVDVMLAPADVFDASQWYGFAVPFPVSVSDGVFQFNEGVASKATDGVDYMIYYYDGMKRYNTGKGWTRMTSGVLNPGEFYYLTVNDGHNVMRFQKTADGALVSDDTKTITAYGDAAVKPADANWNAMGNPMLQHQNADGVEFVQIYVNGESRYTTVRTSDYSFVVGSPFFVQAASGTLDFNAASHAAFYAPGRVAAEESLFHAIELLNTSEKVCDRIYVAAGEKESDGYVLGTDLQKAGVTTRVAQMWIDRYGLKLSVNKETAIADETEFPVVFSAPAAGEYILRATDAAANYSLYLMHNGNLVWDLSSSDYSIDLQKGNTAGYSIVMHRHMPGIATGMDAVSEKSGAEKVLVNGNLYIINQNAVYSAAGKRVK